MTDDTDTDTYTELWHELYGGPDAPQYTEDEQATWDASYGTPAPSPLPEAEQALRDQIYPHD